MTTARTLMGLLLLAATLPGTAKAEDCGKMLKPVFEASASGKNLVYVTYTGRFHWPYTSAKVKDTVKYANGLVVNSGGTFLKATALYEQRNDSHVDWFHLTGSDFVIRPSLTYDITVYPDGKLLVVEKINGKPIGGIGAKVVKGTCSRGVITSVAADDVFLNQHTVSFSMEPMPPF